jgi:hypothetical protein
MIGVPRVQQARQCRRMGGMTGILVDDGPVPFEAVPFQSLDDALRGSRLFAGRIDILDAQQPAAPVAAGL